MPAPPSQARSSTTGYDQHERSSSAGALAAVLAIVGKFACLAILAMGGAAYFWMGARMEREHAIVVEQRAVAEAHRAEARALRAVAEVNALKATADPRLTFEITMDRDGGVLVDGDQIDLAELRKRLATAKDETSNAFTVRIAADTDCPLKLIVPVMAVCDELGDIDYRITATVPESDRELFTATVTAYEPAAEGDHFDDGTFSAYDSLTVKIIAPEQHAGVTLSVSVPSSELPAESAL
jgi:hypothetical protein